MEYSLDRNNFVLLRYRKGMCAVVSMAIAFRTELNDMLTLFKCVAKSPRSGVTYEELCEALKYAEPIYEKRVRKIHWRGKLFEFVKQYPEGCYITNCNGHTGVVIDGIIVANKTLGVKLKNYSVYNAWRIDDKPTKRDKLIEALADLDLKSCANRTEFTVSYHLYNLLTQN